jgi:hypothetical protein
MADCTVIGRNDYIDLIPVVGKRVGMPFCIQPVTLIAADRGCSVHPGRDGGERYTPLKLRSGEGQFERSRRVTASLPVSYKTWMKIYMAGNAGISFIAWF